jgi:hypothetical protein
MTMTRSAALLCAAATLAIAACSKEPAGEPVAETTTAAPAEPITTATASTAAAEDDQTGIPSGLHGRWALVPADCTSTSGDAKGLLVIDGAMLRFYESRAKLTMIKERDANRVRASYAFSGEGQEWKQDVLLDLQDDGKKLVRRDYGPDAMPGALEYTRCQDNNETGAR